MSTVCSSVSAANAYVALNADQKQDVKGAIGSNAEVAFLVVQLLFDGASCRQRSIPGAGNSLSRAFAAFSCADMVLSNPLPLISFGRLSLRFGLRTLIGRWPLAVNTTVFGKSYIAYIACADAITTVSSTVAESDIQDPPSQQARRAKEMADIAWLSTAGGGGAGGGAYFSAPLDAPANANPTAPAPSADGATVAAGDLPSSTNRERQRTATPTRKPPKLPLPSTSGP